MKQFEYCRCYYIYKWIDLNQREIRCCEIVNGKSTRKKIEYYIPTDQILFHDLEEYKKKYKDENKTNEMIAKLYFSDGKELVIYGKRKIEILGALGKDGWEMINEDSSGVNDAIITEFYLKRELTK